MVRLTLKSQAATIAALEKKLEAATAVRSKLQKDVFPQTQGTQIVVISRGHGLSVQELTDKAMEEFSFVSYQAMAEAMECLEPDGRWNQTHSGRVTSFIEEKGIDFLVVREIGVYGSGAADKVPEFHAKLEELGYTVFPDLGKRRTKKAKVKTGDIDVSKLTQALQLLEVMKNL